MTTCPVCLALEALSELHDHDLGGVDFPSRLGTARGHLQWIAIYGRALCRAHQAARGREDMRALFDAQARAARRETS